MSSEGLPRRLCLFFAAMFLMLLATSAPAEVPPQTAFNPKPAEGDLVLPMPGDAEMVFRRVQVPGKGWQRGLNLNRSVNDVIDGDTNAIVLESLAYISRGQMLCLACLSPAPLPSSSAGATP